MAHDLAIPTGKDLIPTESQQVIDRAIEFCASVVEIEIHNDDEYKQSCELTKQVTKYVKDVDTERKAILKPLKDATDFVNDFFREPLKALKNLDEKLRKSNGAYIQMLEDKRLAFQRKADEVARKEREWLEADAREREAKAKALAEAGQTKRAETQLEKAATIQQVATTITAPKIETKVPVIEGVHTRDKYSGIVIDKHLFIAAALNSGQSAMLLECIEINTGKLDKIIAAAKGEIIIPGVKIRVEKKPVFASD